MLKAQFIGFFAFPSPHGDKFQPYVCYAPITKDEFPSPHGDKFQPGKLSAVMLKASFRPLTGINFNTL